MHAAVYINSDLQASRLTQLLEGQGSRCERFPTAAALIHASWHRAFDVMVVDSRGVQVRDDAITCWIRHRPCPATPLLLLHGDGAPERVVHALEAGADVVIAPFSPEELAARVRAAHRRQQRVRGPQNRVEVSGFILDHDAGMLLDRGRLIELTPREFSLAWFLFSNPSCFASREAISHAVWGVEWDIVDHTVEQHIYKLRKKLSLGKHRGVSIRAAYGRGYRLEVHPAPEADFGSSAPAPLDEHASALHIAALIESSWSNKRCDSL